MANGYDSDLTEKYHYQGARLVAECLEQYVDKHASILNAGAGGGLSGVALAAKGYADLVAIDLSEGMLQSAREKGVYRDVHRMVLGEVLDFEDGTFDAVTSVGIFTMAHAPASSFDELIRVTKPGGYIVFTLSEEAYEKAGFKEKLASLESDWKWSRVEMQPGQELSQGSGVLHQLWVFQTSI
ncbi:MAG: SAM-dependent methyltransferase [Chloroflexi bacterium]|jgi:SAM-dependent methyltransferase|nr:MAG: SAM-dependent methyltransferase [Chloroflexota bacterium]